MQSGRSGGARLTQATANIGCGRSVEVGAILFKMDLMKDITFKVQVLFVVDVTISLSTVKERMKLTISKTNEGDCLVLIAMHKFQWKSVIFYF